MELGDRITANAVVPVAATAMTATVPFLTPYVDALEAGQPLPPFARRELGFGTPEDVAGLVAAAWPQTFARHLQPAGQTLPQPQTA